MKTPLEAITHIQKWRLAAITIGSALAMSLAATGVAAPSPPPPLLTAVATSSPAAVWETDSVTLNANGSSGGTAPLSYQWQGPATVSPNNSAVAIVATYTAPAVPLAALTQSVTFKVKVTDSGHPPQNAFSDLVTTTVYASPGADAEPKDMHVNEGTPVQLSGTPTRPQSGATFSYTWTGPGDIVLLNSSTATPTFTAPQVAPLGRPLTFKLVVTEHLTGLPDKDSAPDFVTINVDNVNSPPTAIANTINDPANIVSMATVAENAVGVPLYGFGTDPDGDLIASYSWTQTQGPTVALSDDTSSTPTFTAPNLTTEDHVDLVFRLIVNDAFLSSGPADVTIRVNNTNDPPVAVATAIPVSAFEGDAVTLNGNGSSDPNVGDSLTYLWEQTGGTPVTLTPSGSNATFTAPPVSAAQGSITLDFNLTVSDGQLSDSKPVSVTVSHVNQAPIADAGQDQPGVPEFSNTCLNGSGSYDPDGDTDSLTFAWLQTGGPAVILDNPTSSGPCFDMPNVGPGGVDLQFQLTVRDSHGLSNSDAVLVHVNYINHPPTANAGGDQNVDEGTTVHLDGSGSTDSDGNPLTFSWNQVSGPSVTVVPDPADPSKATVIAPGVECGEEVVVMRLTVDDTYQDGIGTDDMQITVANVNNPPTADAGMNQQPNEGDLVSLHGSGTDADGETLSFQWSQVSGPPVTLTPASGQDASFIAPSVGSGDPDAFIELKFTLTVMDTCTGLTTAGPITVHVANVPHSPVAVATSNPPSANEGGTTVQLDGNGSYDPDSDPLAYNWAQVSGPNVLLVGADTATPSFATPWVSANTPMKFKLTVSDPYSGTSDAYVCVTVINSHTPPDASGAHAEVAVLWPPDHKMAQVHILGLLNPNNDPVTIDTVKQDEPTNGLGDGDTPIDAIISGDSVTLRAERAGNGNGRVYHICFTVHDSEQNATGCVTASVPKSKKTDVAIDGGSLYDSTH